MSAVLVFVSGHKTFDDDADDDDDDDDNPQPWRDGRTKQVHWLNMYTHTMY